MTIYYLDITSDLCPMTFVRVKLLIEKVNTGDILEVRLTGREPLVNVPRSLRELGHDVLELSPELAEQESGVHILRVRKSK